MSKALLFFFLFLAVQLNLKAQEIWDGQGALIRSDQSKKEVYFIFSGHDFDEGFEYVLEVLAEEKIPASFFLTGDFVRSHFELVKRIAQEKHYVGAHSDKHLLYNDWVKRDSLLFSPDVISKDIIDNLETLSKLGIQANYFLPPYEWYNKQIVDIAFLLGQETINFSPGTRSNADYTTPSVANYLSSEEILNSIYDYESSKGMNGFHLLIHPGTSPERKDKFYLELKALIRYLKEKGYGFEKFDNGKNQ